MKTSVVRRFAAWGLVGLVIVSVVVWERTRERMPERIRIATAARGGLYYKLGALLQREIARRSGAKVELIDTEGSVENRMLLMSDRADLAMLQLGTVDASGLVAVAPLYQDVVHVIVRKERGLHSIDALAGARIVLGTKSSGMRRTAELLLDHYGIAVRADRSEGYFAGLESDETLDGAIVTSGFGNPDLARLLRRGKFELLPILQADALATQYAMLDVRTIPKGLYRGRDPVPAQDIRTIATYNILATRENAPEALVTLALQALHESYLEPLVPELTPRSQAASWDGFPLHPAARAYYDPYQSLGLLANLFETLAAIKELLFALGAGLYLAFTYWRGLQQRELARELSRQKDYLDEFLQQTVEIERAQMGVDDARLLQRYLDAVTDIKLRALDELTSEAVRGDQVFAIFLSQCEGLSRKLEARLRAAIDDAGRAAS